MFGCETQSRLKKLYVVLQYVWLSQAAVCQSHLSWTCDDIYRNATTVVNGNGYNIGLHCSRGKCSVMMHMMRSFSSCTGCGESIDLVL